VGWDWTAEFVPPCLTQIRWLSPLAGLVVTGGLLDDDVHAVVGVDEGDERHQRRELVIVVVLGRIGPGLVGDTTGCIGDAGALLGEFQSGPLGLGEDLRLRQTATRLSRTELPPACSASLVCMSVQAAQPLIWLARIFTSSCVAAGRVESDTTAPAELMYFANFAATVLSW